MKKQFLKSLALVQLLSVSSIYAQHFVETTSFIEGTTVSSAKHADVDNDGDIDVLITGYDATSEQAQIAKLFLNDGEGVFTEAMDTPFTGVADGEIAFADVDGDGDEDVMIAGLNINLDGQTNLYLNDGSGVFTLVDNTPFANVYGCDLGFSDVDADGDLDVLVTGFNDVDGALNAVLYSNDGTGLFTAVADTPFQGSWDGSSKFVDVDNDGDEDVIITGRDNIFSPSVILYTNENGVFTEVADLPFIGVLFTAIDYADIDGDGDYDLLISGQNSFTSPVTALYINEGGTFVEDTANPFVDVDFGSHAFIDVDHDGDQDVIITGYGREQGVFATTTKLYINDGLGVFTEATEESFLNVGTSAVTVFDANGDNADDIFIIGDANAAEPMAALYLNTNEVVSSTEVLAAKSSFSVYPNPVKNGLINIYLAENLLNTAQDLKIFDASAKLVYTTNIEASQSLYTLTLADLAKGVYFVELTNKRTNSSETIKLIVE